MAESLREKVARRLFLQCEGHKKSWKNLHPTLKRPYRNNAAEIIQLVQQHSVTINLVLQDPFDIEDLEDAFPTGDKLPTAVVNIVRK